MAVMLLAGLTLLPALLAILGRGVFWAAKTRPRDHFEGVWGKIAARLVRRPVRTLGAGVVVLGALPLFALGFKPSGSLGMSQRHSGQRRRPGQQRTQNLLPLSQVPTRRLRRGSPA